MPEGEAPGAPTFVEELALLGAAGSDVSDRLVPRCEQTGCLGYVDVR